MNATATKNTSPATMKQVAYLESLVKQRDPQNLEVGIVAWLLDGPRPELTVHYASTCIDALLKLPKFSQPAPFQPEVLVAADLSKPAAPVEYAIGIYDTMPDKGGHDFFYSGRYVLFTKNVHGLYVAKKLWKSYSTQSGYTWQKASSYSAKKHIADGLYKKLAQDEIGSIGKNFNMCMYCGAVLSDELSVSLGVGPVCAKKFSH